MLKEECGGSAGDSFAGEDLEGFIWFVAKAGLSGF
jgi:hypothetical protein